MEVYINFNLDTFLFSIFHIFDPKMLPIAAATVVILAFTCHAASSPVGGNPQDSAVQAALAVNPKLVILGKTEDGKVYLVENTRRLNWLEARGYCKELGADVQLGTIQSQIQADFILSKADDLRGEIENGYWLYALPTGGSDGYLWGLFGGEGKVNTFGIGWATSVHSALKLRVFPGKDSNPIFNNELVTQQLFTLCEI